MTSLDFIVDKELKRTLEDSIEFIFALHNSSKLTNQNILYQEETCRVIILYVISAIEAVLLYFFKLRGEKMEKLEYRFVHQFPAEYSHKHKANLPLVVAVQENIVRQDYEIGLHSLVTFFKEKKLIIKETARKILELNDVRNTFHFSKIRDKKCDLGRVEEALALLLYTLEKAPRGLRKI